MKPDTIQDLLTRAGYVVDQDKKQFTKSISFMETVTIPFDELAGYTVDSFVEKAKRRGWLPESFSFAHLAMMDTNEQSTYIVPPPDPQIVSGIGDGIHEINLPIGIEFTLETAPLFSILEQTKKKLEEIAPNNSEQQLILPGFGNVTTGSLSGKLNEALKMKAMFNGWISAGKKLAHHEG